MSSREKDVVWEHGENLYPGWRCNYCHMSKAGGGATRLKQHLAGRGTEVLHCRKVSREVREYFQREIERTKKATADRAREKLRKEEVAAEGNYPGGDEAYDEEAELERAMHESRAEEEYRQRVQQRGGAYEHGGGSGSRGGNPVQRIFRRATSLRQTPGVMDYNLGSAKGSTQPRIDTGSWTQKGKNAKEAIGRAWSKFFHIAGVPGRQADNPYFVSAVRETQKWGKFYFHANNTYATACLSNLMIAIWLQVKVSRHPQDGILMASTWIKTSET